MTNTGQHTQHIETAQRNMVSAMRSEGYRTNEEFSELLNGRKEEGKITYIVTTIYGQRYVFLADDTTTQLRRHAARILGMQVNEITSVKPL